MRIVLSSVLLLLATAAHGEETWEDVCESFGSTSESIMEQRQKGVPMSKLMKAIGGMDASEHFLATLKDIVIEAYEEPQYRGDDYTADAVRRFRNKVELDCYKAL